MMLANRRVLASRRNQLAGSAAFHAHCAPLLLSKTLKRAILAPQEPGIGGMSVYTVPQVRALREATYFAGLRNADAGGRFDGAYRGLFRHDVGGHAILAAGRTMISEFTAGINVKYYRSAGATSAFSYFMKSLLGKVPCSELIGDHRRERC